MIRHRTFSLLAALLVSTAAQAQHDRTIRFPDVPGYLTLVCDLHLHTVFSDGQVWPDIRVEEAVRDGLDAIAVTEHLEYQPHSHDIPNPDRNRAFEIAASVADQDLIVINGSEITRALPPGHSNAVFLTDSNRLLLDDTVEIFREARRQDAFIFWNHPNWTSQAPDGMATLTDMHRMLISEDLLHGIEVVNEDTYSDEALRIALDHDLAMLGTSDAHGLVDWQFKVPQGGHRPVTLVFADERSETGIKRALRARRTAVWFRNTLIGREAEILPLVEASIAITEARYRADTFVLDVTFTNSSDAAFTVRNLTDYTFHDAADVIEIAPNTSTRLAVKTRETLLEIDLTFEVLTAVTAPGVHPSVTLSAAVTSTDR